MEIEIMLGVFMIVFIGSTAASAMWLASGDEK